MAQWKIIQLPIQETRVQSLSRVDPLEKEMATHSSIIAWRTLNRGDWQATIHRVAKSQTQLSTHAHKSARLSSSIWCPQLNKCELWLLWHLSTKLPFIHPSCFLSVLFLIQSLLDSWYLYLGFYLFIGHKACEILFPQPGAKPVPVTLEAWSLNNWTTRQVPALVFY